MRRHRSIGLCAFLLVGAISATAAKAAILDGVAAMGDSATDGSAVSGSWVPVLTNNRGWNFGPGRIYNVAQGGATTTSVLSQGQHTDVRDFVSDGDVSLGILLIGTNDFGTTNTIDIASGALSGAALDSWIQTRVDNITTAVTTVLGAGPEGFVLFGVPDVTLLPLAQSFPLTAIERQRVVDTVDAINDQLRDLAIAEQFAFIETPALMRDFLPGGTIQIGGVSIDTDTAGSGPYFFQDGIHPGAVGNGILANIVIEAVNLSYGTSESLLSDLEILTLAGLQSQYTGETFMPGVDLSQYVVVPVSVPEPTAFVLAAISMAGLVIGLRHRSRN